MILSWRMVVLGLMLNLHGQDATKDEVKECILSCGRKIEDDVCKNTCLELLQEHKTNETQAPLLNPGVPTFVSSEFRSIRLVWNATNRSAVRYIVNVDPQWNYRGANVIFPIVTRYYKANKTIYTVENLLAKTKYKFRVAAVTLSETSSFSNWSNVFHTNYTCSKPPCSVTNVRLKLTLFKPYKQMTQLNGTLYWEPTTEQGFPRHGYKSYVAVNSLTQAGFCDIKFQQEFSKRGDKEKLTSKNHSSLQLIGEDTRLKTDLHFGCLYSVKIGLVHNLDFQSPILWNWKLYIPKCLAGVCGCEFSEKNILEDSFVHINLTQTLKNTSSLNVIWNNENWWGAINVAYYRVNLKHNFDKYEELVLLAHIDSMEHIYNYSKSFFNLTNGEKYTLEITAFHNDSCIHERMKRLEFIVSYPCLNKSSCSGNSACQRDGWLGKFECICLPGFREFNGICEDSNPCRNHSCPMNASCYEDGPTGTGFTCDCDYGFKKVNNVCQAIDICKENRRAKGCMNAAAVKNDNTGTIVASVVPPLVFIIIIVSLLFFYQRRYQNKRLGTLARVMDSVAFNSSSGITTLTNNYDYQHPVTVALPTAKCSFEDDRSELNVLYVPIEIKNAIAKGLTDGIFELSSDRIKFHRVIGNGAFGEVYHGEAHGILDNLGWMTVAVKKLADSATISEIHDFMEEIELMKLLGRHDNVIEMYGCCTLSPPICLIMEFASKGNLLDYLRSLKRKGEKTALGTKNPGKQDICESEKNKFEKFFEPGEMPDQLESDVHMFPGAAPLSKDSISNNNVKQAEAENVEIATKVNQEIQTALHPKELESFARQIASGMTHVSDLGIIHRDLAARNILIAGNRVLKISDFGLSREGIYVKKTGGKIPLRWLSIEAIQERRYSTASDVWAFGIVLWEICTLGDVPYPFVSDKDLLDFLISGKRMKKAASCSDEIHEIMMKCWRYRPQDRPTFAELSKFLWQLEHEGNTYVNTEPLIISSSLPPNEADGRTGDIEQEKDANPSYEPESSPQKSPRGIDNPGFWKSIGDLSFDVEQNILPRKQKSQFKSKDVENPALPISNSILNRGDGATNAGQNTPDT